VSGTQHARDDNILYFVADFVFTPSKKRNRILHILRQRRLESLAVYIEAKSAAETQSHEGNTVQQRETTQSKAAWYASASIGAGLFLGI
jgi:hypothetical protein